MKRARRLILCLVMFSAIMLCTAHAFVPSPEPCEHTNTAHAAKGNDCVLVCVDCEEIVNGPWEHSVHCTTGECSRCGATGVEGWIFHDVDLDTYKYSDTQHWYACKNCDEAFLVYNHQLSCTTGACIRCGATGVTGDTYHDRDWDTDIFQYSDTHHWHACKDCGDPGRTGMHVVSCETGACTTCGAPGVTGIIDHDWDEDNYQYTDTQHWIVCKKCDAIARLKSHVVSCETGACTTCGATCDPSKADVRHSYGYAYNEKTHWKECTICGYVDRDSTEAHRANCADKVCRTCGMENVTIGTFTHGSTESSTYSFDETKHWCVCKDCGGKVYEYTHTISCKDGTCQECGQSGVKGEISHNWVIEYEHNEYGHWCTCVDCGMKSGNQHWVDCSQSTCSYCGAPVNEWFTL